ncbi:hypothetical protein EIN_083050 [Entamoeba invadens IP1]|uniref:hypothetical protein n=1 Tax=Entamoeba invadens IP1 TaxID=370355 RepID=UPI0002C3FBE1|nr:hypothetical protein EIN_083050 [Entamoeba invadens IP1]ELP85193.1 hypothetical protein EIN_083050 [Entamoeba invadens IP1]|eukprot:XP_004184539.1 hypothetical protein EIN_083050 [Entamoeba invadens IP1]
MNIAQGIVTACDLIATGNTENLRTATQLFNEMEKQPTFPITCLEVLTSQAVDSVKVQTAIQFKRHMKAHFTQISPNNRAVYKEAMMKVILQSPLPIQRQISDVFSVVFFDEFPVKCQDVLRMITIFFQDVNVIQNENAFMGLMMILNKLTKMCRCPCKQTKDMTAYFATLYPVYFKILEASVNNKVYKYTRVLLKTFRYVTFTEIPAFFTAEKVKEFFTVTFNMFSWNIEFNTDDHPQCKAFVQLLRIISQFVNNSTGKKEGSTQASKYFCTQICGKYLEKVVLFTRMQTPEELTFYILNFFSHSLKLSNLNKFIVGVFPEVFEKLVFANVLMPETEIIEMKEDPINFLRGEEEDLQYGIDARVGAMNFVRSSMQFRAKLFLPMYIEGLKFLIPMNAETMKKDTRAIDAACFIVQKILPSFVIDQVYMNYIPLIFSISVPLLLQSNDVLLIRRGCLLLSDTFNVLNLNCNDVLPEYIVKDVQLVFGLLSSENVLLRVYAATTIGNFVSYKTLNESFATILPQLFGVLLQTLKVYECEGILETISILIEKFKTQTVPLSAELAKGIYETIIGIENKYDAMEDEKRSTISFSVSSAVNSLNKIIKLNAEANPQFALQLGNTFLTYIDRVFGLQSQFAHDTFEDFISLLCELVIDSPTPFPENLITVFVKLLSNEKLLDVDGTALDATEPIVTTVAAKQPELFAIDQVMLSFEKLVVSALQIEDMEHLSVLRMSQSVLLCCEGMANKFIEFVIPVVVNFINLDESAVLQSVNTIMFCFFNNPRLTFACLIKMSALEHFFNIWTYYIPKQLPMISDKKINIIGMSSMLTIPLDDLPPLVKDNLVAFYTSITVLLQLAQNQKIAIENYKQKSDERISRIVNDSGIHNLADDEDLVVDDHYNDDEPDIFEKNEYEGEDIVDDEDEVIPLNERKFFYNCVQRVTEGDLKDQRHINAIASLQPELKNVIQAVFIEQTQPSHN